MRLIPGSAVALGILFAGTLLGDIVNPSRLELVETTPHRWAVTLTLPVVEGRVLKARPVLPDFCVVLGDGRELTTGFSVTRVWELDCNQNSLIGAAIGVDGLLGTSQEVMLTLQMLDGRKFSRALRATQPFLLVLHPPSFIRIAGATLWKGANWVLLRFELVLLVLILPWFRVRSRLLLGPFLVFALAQMLGQWLASNLWIKASPVLPLLLAGLAAFLASFQILERSPLLGTSSVRHFWAMMLGLGLLFGASQPEAIDPQGLSGAEQGVGYFFFSTGTLVGLTLLLALAQQWKRVAGWLPERLWHWASHGTVFLIGGLAVAAILYQLLGLTVGTRVSPELPAVTWLTGLMFGVWCRRQNSPWLGVLGIVAFGAGTALGWSHLDPPYVTLVILATLAALGVSLLVRRLPVAFAMPLAGLALLYQGWHGTDLLRTSLSQPLANSIGAVVLLGVLAYTGYRVYDAASSPAPVIGLAVITVAAAAFWRLMEYSEWVQGPVAADWVLGLIPIPVTTVLLGVAAIFLWPRRRRFSVTAERKPFAHWVLLGSAFFLLPIGCWRVPNPLHRQTAPTAVEVKPVIETLLSNTYFAFNLKDEDAAFDRLFESISRNLVADVYLDSRRRLVAGTREGAEVTVRDVTVVSVTDRQGGLPEEQEFTYPCQWVVTARVRHLQHIHNRQNIYIGELTIRIEGDRWKIADLRLKSEEQVILSWQSS
ncbi:MAG: hypothetical protein JSU96_09790 [Acidobacteriota bacterium]|nr:MAG: hypothetical protein JSU96_09790 [Acidobacteriota bacterium]